MADERTYIRIHDGMPDHPKIAAVGGDAGWLDVCAIAYCARNATDGVVPKALVPRLSDRKRPAVLAGKLLAAGRWHQRGHGCPRCPDPGPEEYVVHDYLEHQRSAEEIAELRRKRSEAGARGGKAKASAMASAKQTPEQTGSKSLPESETDTDLPTSLRSVGPRRGTRLPDHFVVTDEMKRWFAEHCPRIADPRLEHDKFCNYWQAKAGRDAVKVDWVKTWRNWMLTAQQNGGGPPRGGASPNRFVEQ